MVGKIPSMVGERRMVALEFLFYLMSEGIEFYIFKRLIIYLSIGSLDKSSVFSMVHFTVKQTYSSSMSSYKFNCS